MDRAEALARTITEPLRPGPGARPAWPPSPPRPATWTAPTGWPPTPRPSPAAITNPAVQAQALTGLATAVAQAGTGPRYRLAADAEALARTITDPYVQARALTDLATAAAQAGD